MDSSVLLLEYLKEQYTQARQHETRQTAATSLLTGAAAVILGFAFKDGSLIQSDWWIGIPVLLVGAANFWINQAHHKGNRFHTKLAGKTRHALEAICENWEGKKPTELRKEVLLELGLNGPDVSIGKTIYCALQIVPIATMIMGIFLVILAQYGVGKYSCTTYLEQLRALVGH